MVFHNATLTLGCQPVSMESSRFEKTELEGEGKVQSTQGAEAAALDVRTGKDNAGRSQCSLFICNASMADNCGILVGAAHEQLHLCSSVSDLLLLHCAAVVM
jgi:hypothetical protein